MQTKNKQNHPKIYSIGEFKTTSEKGKDQIAWRLIGQGFDVKVKTIINEKLKVCYEIEWFKKL